MIFFRRCAFSLVPFVIFFSFTAEIYAHALPLAYDPQPGSVAQSLSAARIRLSERLEVAGYRLDVFNIHGARVDAGDAFLDPRDPYVLRVSLSSPLPYGSYTVSWRAVSFIDGHFSRGKYDFFVGIADIGATSTPVFTLVAQGGSGETSAIFLELFGYALVLGILFFHAILFRRLHAYDRTISRFERWYRVNVYRVMWCALGLIITGSLSFFVLKSFELSAFEGIHFFSALRLFFETRSGIFALIRFAFGTFVCLYFFARHHRIISSSRITRDEIVLWTALAGVVFFRAFVSHAAASAYPLFAVAMNSIHLFAKLSLVGTLVILALFGVLFTLHIVPRSVQGMLAAFGRFAGVAIALGGVSGVYLMWLHLKRFVYLDTTEWGNYFLLLSFLTFVFLFFRLYHTFFLRFAARLFRVTISLEALIGVAILFVSSILIITTPPLESELGSLFERTNVVNGVHFVVREDPITERDMIVAAHAPGLLHNFSVFLLVLDDPQHRIIPVLTERGGGDYSFPLGAFDRAGNWEVNSIASYEDGRVAHARFPFSYPYNLAYSGDVVERSARIFDRVMLFSGILVVLLGFVLYRLSYFRWSFTPRLIS